MKMEWLLIAIVTLSIVITLFTIISTLIYRNRIKKELIQLSDALEAQVDGKSRKAFSEIEDVLLSKIQKQLRSLDDLWTERYAYEKKGKGTT